MYQGGNLRAKAGGGDSLKGLKKTLFTKPAQWVFEMDVKRCTDDNLDIDFHYCPLVKAWQKQGCSDEEIQLLCDHAMCGDRGIAESFGCELALPATTMLGALANYINTENKDFQPMGANMGLLPPMEDRVRDKRLRYLAVAQRGLDDLEAYLQTV